MSETELEERTDVDAAGLPQRRYRLAGGLLDGEMVEFDAEGRTAAVLPHRAGVLDGVARYYDRGRLRLEIAYRDGLPEGTTTIYDEEGRVTTTQELRGGKLHGLASWYRPDGSLLRTASYVAGELDGETVDYDEKGKAQERKLYRAGTPVQDAKRKGARR